MRYTLPLVLYMMLMWVLSSMPGNNEPLPFPGFDKMIHIAEYFIFGILLFRALSAVFKYLSLDKILIFYFMFAVFWAVSDEIHQYFVPMRQMDVFDLAADVIGVCLSLWVFKIVRKFVKC